MVCTPQAAQQTSSESLRAPKQPHARISHCGKVSYDVPLSLGVNITPGQCMRRYSTSSPRAGAAPLSSTASTSRVKLSTCSTRAKPSPQHGHHCGARTLEGMLLMDAFHIGSAAGYAAYINVLVRAGLSPAPRDAWDKHVQWARPYSSQIVSILFSLNLMYIEQVIQARLMGAQVRCVDQGTRGRGEASASNDRRRRPTCGSVGRLSWQAQQK